MRVLSKFYFRLFINEENVDEEQLLQDLIVAQESVWLKLLVMIVVAVCVIFVIINIIGCFGACTLSYSLLSGFAIVTLLISVLALTLACTLLLPLHNSNSTSPLAPLVNIVAFVIICGFAE